MTVRRLLHTLLLTTLLLSLNTAAQAQRWRAGLFQSPKGVGITVMMDTWSGTETNVFTARTDFYGFLSGRTDRIGAFFTYTHDYLFFLADGPDYSIDLLLGAGGSFGFAYDYEKGFFSSFDRKLDHTPGGVLALAGDVGVRIDFRRRISLDMGFHLEPGIHMRTDPETGALLLSFYRNGIYRGYYPYLNLLYRF